MTLNTATKQLNQIPCTQLKGVGKVMSERLQKCNIETLQDLLFHLPYRYQDRTHVTPIASLRVNDYAVIEGIIESAEITTGRRATLLLQLRDGTGRINIRFFHFNASQREGLSPGTRMRCFGEVRFSFKTLEMTHPEYRRIFSDKPVPVEETLTPIYPSTSGLNQKALRNLTQQGLALLENDYKLTEYLPGNVLQQFQLPDINEAVLFIHQPPPDANIQQLLEGTHPAQQRLAFEELLAHRLSLRKLRANIQKHPAPVLQGGDELTENFRQQLPFTLTQAQERVLQEIKEDIQVNHPMLRLVQGDVGSGKTVVAALAMLAAVSCDYQAALMAPTDILAEQHYQTFAKWLESLDIKVAWLAGKHKGKARRSILEDLALGTAKVAVGTHALFQEGVNFAKLGFVVIDEQHRFGVHQRLALREKGIKDGVHPHQLIMTATPIPRTLSMTAYADLDVSVIDELPPGRKPVKTVVLPDNKRSDVIARIEKVCEQQRQVYWVCPLIEESEVLQCQAAEKTEELLIKQLPGLNIGLIHGRMKPKEKEAIMSQFKNHELDLLVATTVIEVGVDVPNASLMIIENAERLGLSQLHQLRGRIGRGSTESFCVLLYQGELSHMAKERLQVMRQSNDGFVIAQKDLELRGPGEVLGTKQTGLIQFRIADLKRDKDLLPNIQQAATQLFQHHKEVINPIIHRWLSGGEKYGVV